MEDQNIDNNAQPVAEKGALKRKCTRWPFYVIIVLLLGSNGFLGWKVYNQKVIIQKVVEVRDNTQLQKQLLTDELNDLVIQYESMKTTNARINQQLESEQEKIKGLINEIKTLKNYSTSEIKKYKAEIETLRSIMRSYVVQIDSLNTVNMGLKAENKKVKQEVEKEKTNVKELETKTEVLTHKVNVASVIKAANIVSAALNKRSKEVTKAKKVKKFRINFTLMENSIAQPGMKDVYLRIARPDGLVLASSDQDLFKFGNEMIVFSAKRQVDYQGKNADAVIYWDNNTELPEGVYTIDLFTEGNLIGSSKIELK